MAQVITNVGRPSMTHSGDNRVDAFALEADLRREVQGEVRFAAGDRALYATDASNYRQTPIGVVVPRDTHDVVATVAACRRHGAPLLPRGGGTSLAGQCCNVAVVVDTSKYMHDVLDVDPDRKLARVQPGTVLDDLRTAAEQYHLTFGPDPATHSHCTLGGMIGNNSCGVHSVMAGKTDDNVHELEILTYDGLRLRVGQTDDKELAQIIAAGGRRGQIYAALRDLRDRYADLIRQRFPDIPRRVSGYGLDQLLPEHGFHVARALVGSEATCVTVLEATVRLVHSPPARKLVVLGYPDVFSAADHVMEILEHKPVGLEGFGESLISDLQQRHLYLDDVRLLPDGGGWLLVEFGAESDEDATARARSLIDALKRKDDAPSIKLVDNPAQAAKIWAVREAGLAAAARVPTEGLFWPGWEDSAVPPARFGAYLRDLRALMNRYHYGGAFYGHFGQACLHTRINFDLTSAQGIATFRRFIFDAAELVVRYGGSVSGEHGDGQARAELLPMMYGEELVRAFGEFKAIWDPDGKMNPGKVVAPYRIDQNLRLGTTYDPPRLQTHFAFPDDHGSFASATLRCVGIGKCRREGGGTMCPSYMVTREEEHSTRGRARLLFEMLHGDPLRGGWRADKVHEALDLCLACKGCKSDCPVNVDMATYKAEFLAHYYAGRLRPVTAYSMGLIYWWSRLAAYMPGTVNAVTHAPLIGDAAKRLAGIAPERSIPAFAPYTFKGWFRRRPPRNEGKPDVLLWPDTFNNHFHPQTAIAAVEVLEAAGYHVVVPAQSLCCGRPLYDFGMLGLARRLLRQILATLHPYIAAGVPLVGLEPSCVAVFRDELLGLMPHDEDAQRLAKQSFLLGEFLIDHVDGYQPPRLARRAVVHGHCHHKAIMGMDAEKELFARLGLEYEVLDSGCCGMAGSFGFERGEHYDVSIQCGERVLLPAVRQAAPDTLVVADGFSCREQIAQTTERRALHPAQIVQMALRAGSSTTGHAYPEKGYVDEPAHQAPVAAALVGAGALVAGAAAWKAARQRGR